MGDVRLFLFQEGIYFNTFFMIFLIDIVIVCKVFRYMGRKRVSRWRRRGLLHA